MKEEIKYCKHTQPGDFKRVELKDWETTGPDGFTLATTDFKYCPECGTVYLKEIPTQ